MAKLKEAKKSAKGENSRQSFIRSQHPVLSLFAFSPFVHPSTPVLDNRNLMTNALVVANAATGRDLQLVSTSTETKADRHPLVEPQYEAAVERLGQDKYVESNDLFHCSSDVDHVMQDGPVEFVENSSHESERPTSAACQTLAVY